ncbi:hypothetical protein LAZ67_12002608 [Cordylochernes scorpioides]|uniref:RNA-directed DNA polymerase n=1 Tax=Cordylochernes scorpioides TaxID=51811 RepID=A0ABY6L2Q8_9ARAC|nr:hypothetical protein LAZ67_12002608 [Cordylochernes scorpioides]
MAHVDGMSRAPVDDPRDTMEEIVEKNLEVCLTITLEEQILMIQHSDPELRDLIQIFRKDPCDRTVGEQNRINDYSYKGGRLFRMVKNGEEERALYVIPKSMRKSLVVKFHDLMGHFATDRTVNKIKELYWFPSMKRYVRRHVAMCLECLFNKVPGGKQQGFLHPIKSGKRPFSIVHMDHVGPFVRSTKGNQELLVIVDNLTRFVRLSPVRNTSTQNVLKVMKSFVNDFGLPDKIISDRGSCFTSKQFEEFCRGNGIHHTLNSTKHPQGNGMVERVNRTVLSTIATSIEDPRRKDWDLKIKEVERDLNNAVNKTTNKTPFETLHGYSPRFHDGILRRLADEDVDPWTEPDRIQESVRSQIENKQEIMKTYYDKKRCRTIQFEVGEIVVMRHVPKMTGEPTKAQPKYRGPLIITEVLPSDTYRVTQLSERTSGRFYTTTAHISQLKSWHSEEDDSATEESPDEEPEVEDTPRRNPRRSCNARFNRGRLKSRNGRILDYKATLLQVHEPHGHLQGGSMLLELTTNQKVCVRNYTKPVRCQESLSDGGRPAQQPGDDQTMDKSVGPHHHQQPRPSTEKRTQIPSPMETGMKLSFALSDILSFHLNLSRPPAKPFAINYNIFVFRILNNNRSTTNIMKATKEDAELQELKETIIQGWPDQKSLVPLSCRRYWNIKDELSIHEDLVLRGTKIIIPESIKKQVLKQIHEGHLGITGCTKKAKDSIYWAGMSKDISDMVENCKTCIATERDKQKQPLMLKEIPELPWEIVASDIFQFEGNEYIVIIDSYSGFINFELINTINSKDTIGFLKRNFSIHGIPKALETDNGRNYASREFNEFSNKWKFNHKTSSPHYSKSNGLTERAVQIAKNILRKCKQSGDDIQIALLNYRNTPREDMGSPAQRLLAIRTKTILPISKELLRPCIQNDVTLKLRRSRNKQKFYYDKGSRDEPTFKIGQEVYLRENRRNWKPATIVREDGPRSYTVQNNKGLYRRNQSHITTNQSQRDHESILEQEPSGSACSTLEQDQETQPKGSDRMELQSETDNPAGE